RELQEFLERLGQEQKERERVAIQALILKNHDEKSEILLQIVVFSKCFLEELLSEHCVFSFSGR
ncbi:hypothetical protein ABHA40_10290, partial [Enterococcus mundtii]